MKKSYTQLNLVQRAKIQILLKEKKSLQEIANELNVSRQTIYRELTRNYTTESYDRFGIRSSCEHYLKCKQERGKTLFCDYKCENYKIGRATCLRSYPFVCNFCSKKKGCQFLHYYYDAEIASSQYHTRIKEANDLPLTDLKEIKKLDKKITPLIRQGQSIEAILMSHTEIKNSSSTIRRWIEQGLLTCKKSELRLFGRRTPKRYDYSKNKEHLKLNERKLGHKYSDYLLYIKEHPDSLIIQLDTVIGCIDGEKSVLTIHIVQHKFQFGIILDNHTKNEVYTKFKILLDTLYAYEEEYGKPIFSSFTQVILTDNGTEFDALLDLLIDYPNINIFFCHPNSSYEKGACERNHVLVRYVQYKGRSFDNLSQNDINILFSNINSYPRKSLNKKTPYQSVFDDHRLGKKFLDFVNIFKVNCDDIILNPSLLYKVKN